MSDEEQLKIYVKLYNIGHLSEKGIDMLVLLLSEGNKWINQE